MDTPNAPADVYVSDLTFASPRKLTDVNPQIRDLALGETEIVTWKSSDGTPVEGVLIKPVGYQPGQRYPLLVEAHGGPTGATNAGVQGELGIAGTGVGRSGLGDALSRIRAAAPATARSSRAPTSWTGAAATTATS